MSRRLLGALLLVSVAGAWQGRAALDARAPREEGRELLYLPNGRYLKVISLGHAPLVADLVYLWAIQYYSGYQGADRFRYVEHVFGGVIAELDPHYLDPYWLGALILIVEGRDLEAGLRLLDRGAEANPDRWILPYLAGWECHHAGEFARAAAYFERASSIAGAPAFVMRMRAGMIARAGDVREAIRTWEQVAADPRSDAGARAIAERQIRGLRVRRDLADLTEAIEAFRDRSGRYPRRLEDLVQVGLLGAIPLDPDGRPYAYDRGTGRPSSEAARVLGAP